MARRPSRWRFAVRRLIFGALLPATLAWDCQPRDADPEPVRFVPDEPDVHSSTDAVSDGEVVVVDSPGAIGSACREGADCQGDVCLPSDEYPGGYCSRTDCSERGCGEEAYCVDIGDGSMRCLDECRAHSDCRDGYSCNTVGSEGVRVCEPGEPPPPNSFERTRSVLGAQCDPTVGDLTADGRSYRFEFTLGDRATGFLMVPYVESGDLRPISLATPKGTLDLEGEYRHHNARLMEVYSAGEDLTGFGTFGRIAFDWPIAVPYAPRFENYLVPGGSYELRVSAEKESPCLYVLENSVGATLDLNFYVVGLKGGLSAEEAERDADLNEAIEWMRHIYEKVDIELGTLRYFELSSEVASEYERVRSREEALRLTAYGKPPDETRDGHLSVDVFLVEDLQIDRSGEGSVLGMSAGIPGAAGLHGNARNGLIFQTADLGSDNRHVGLIMAHEISHFIGLRHTTEVVHDTSQGSQLEDSLGTTDPIEDTAVCSNIYDKLQDGDYDDCEDFDNLMFPVAPPAFLGQDPRLTSGQGAAMKANPLVKSE